MKKIIIISIIILSIIAAALFGYTQYVKSKVPKIILTFEDCSNAGNLVVDTNPRECHTKDGNFYVEEDNHVALAEFIEVTDPKPYTVLTTPFKVEGKAKSVWYGNNRLNIKLLDQNKKLLAVRSAFALSDTGKDAWVSFVTAIDFKAPALDRGTLLIEKVSTVDIPGKNGPLIIPIRYR